MILDTKWRNLSTTKITYHTVWHFSVPSRLQMYNSGGGWTSTPVYTVLRCISRVMIDYVVRTWVCRLNYPVRTFWQKLSNIAQLPYPCYYGYMQCIIKFAAESLSAERWRETLRQTKTQTNRQIGRPAGREDRHTDSHARTQTQRL